MTNSYSTFHSANPDPITDVYYMTKTDFEQQDDLQRMYREHL